MKSQMFSLVLFIIGVLLCQSTHQYRLSKRELNENHLTHFIIATCSADTAGELIRNLCDHTLQSALMGNFPLLLSHCKTIGNDMSFCGSINHYRSLNEEIQAKRLFSRRLIRSLTGDDLLSGEEEQEQDQVDTDNHRAQKVILQMCLVKTGSISDDVDEYCNSTLENVQQGDSDVDIICKFYPRLEHCRHVRPETSFLSQLSPASSFLPSAESVTPSANPSIIPFPKSNPTDSPKKQ